MTHTLRRRTGPRSEISRTVVVLLAAVLGLALIAPPVTAATGDLVSVIVRGMPGTGNAPEQAVASLGGSVTRRFELINGFAADVPVGAVGVLARHPDVAAVTANGAMRLEAAGWEDATSLGSYNPNTFDGSMYRVAQSVVKANDYWDEGYTGQGIDIALIDSGVVPVEGLLQPGKIINGPDLSFESQADNLRYLDMLVRLLLYNSWKINRKLLENLGNQEGKERTWTLNQNQDCLKQAFLASEKNSQGVIG